MNLTIHPSRLGGSVRAPASKSSMQRALAAALLTKGATIISNPGHSHDDLAVINLVEMLGATVKKTDGQLIIESEGVLPGAGEVSIGESGLGTRMFVPIIALSDKKITIRGEGSLKTRPINFFDKILPQLGVKVKTNNGKLPMVIQGPLQPTDIEIDGSLSSQFLTGLLMAFGASFYPPAERLSYSKRAEVSITVRNLKSKPYIDLTLDLMKQFGMPVPENKNYKEFIFRERSISYSPPATRHYTVESDWSGGALLLVAGALAGPITVQGLDLTSSQADKAIIDVLMAANAGIAIEAKGIKIHPAEMAAFEFDATDCPDLFPPLVALAAYCTGETRIQGITRLEHKESNRALTLQEEFGKMGVVIDLQDDWMTIRGGKPLKGARVHSHHDHRIAMACAVASLGADGKTIIEDADAVKKSYPDFFEDLQNLGARIDHPFSIPGEE